MLCCSLIKIWNLANHMNKQDKMHQNAKSIVEKLKTKGLMFFVWFFHVICKVSNFNIWTTKHLAQASFTELTLIVSCKLFSRFLAQQWSKTFAGIWVLNLPHLLILPKVRPNIAQTLSSSPLTHMFLLSRHSKTASCS